MNKSHQAIENIVIVGSGAVAWLAAALLAKSTGGRNVSISVVDDGRPDEGGEPTLSQFPGLLLTLGIDEHDFMRETGAAFRLASRYRDWNRPGHHYFEPCGAHGASIEYVAFHHFAQKARLAGAKTRFNEYSLAATAAAHARFSHPSTERGSILSTLAYGYHLDSALLAGYFRNMAQALGVHRVEAPTAQVRVDQDSGFIRAIGLGDGREIAGELFLDCSGPEALLIEDALGTGFEDWSKYLPSNRYVGVATASGDALPVCTLMQADDTGWLQYIPLRHQNKYRYFFNNQFITDDQAMEILTGNVAGELLSEAAIFNVSPGHRSRTWNGNCIAFGTAAGEVDLLGGSRLQLVQTGISRLLELFPDQDCNAVLVTEFNRRTLMEYQNIRDFAQLHYLDSERGDCPFWNQSGKLKLSDSLAHKIRLFSSHGQVATFERETFDVGAWASVFIGQERWPADYDPVLDSYDMSGLRSRFGSMRELISQAVRNMQGHRAYLDHYAPC